VFSAADPPLSLISVFYTGAATFLSSGFSIMDMFLETDLNMSEKRKASIFRGHVLLPSVLRIQKL
jgi:hypothetical protein